MASGSFFTVLRERPDKPTNRKELRQVLSSKNKMPEFPHFVRLSDYEYADTKKRVKLDVLFQAQFCSTLNMLRDYFQLSPYSEAKDSDTLELTHIQVHALWQATQYLLNAEYSKRTEQLLDNEFIDVLSPLSADYMAWRMGESSAYEDEIDAAALRRLADILRSIRTIATEVETDVKIRVLYKVW